MTNALTESPSQTANATSTTTIALVVVIVVLLLLLAGCTVLQIANVLRARATRREGREGEDRECQEIHTKENEAYSHFSGGREKEVIGLTERSAGADVDYEEIPST